MTRIEKRIQNIRRRIRMAEIMIERWQRLAHYTTRKQTRDMALRRVEKFEERRDRWEDRLAQAELA